MLIAGIPAGRAQSQLSMVCSFKHRERRAYLPKAGALRFRRFAHAPDTGVCPFVMAITCFITVRRPRGNSPGPSYNRLHIYLSV